MLKLGLRVFFLAFLFFPYVLLFLNLNEVQMPELSEIIWVTKNTWFQALGSAFFSVLFGWLLAQGIYQWSHLFGGRHLGIFRSASYLPFFLPTLFVLLVMLSMVEPFPLGIKGIIFVQTLMNSGVVGWILKERFDDKLLSYGEMASVFGSSYWNFWKSAFVVIKSDLLLVFLFVFSMSLSSFAIPLIVGGGFGTTLEVLIYEKIRVSGDWGQATVLSLLQAAFLLVISLFPKTTFRSVIGRSQATPYFRSWIGLFSLVFFCLFWVYGFFSHALEGYRKVFEMDGLWLEAQRLILPSFGLALSVSMIVFLLLMISCWTIEDKFLQKVFVSFLAPSAAILGFVMVFLFPFGEQWAKEKWVLGMAVLLFGVLYRWSWADNLQSLKYQIETARVFGASSFQIFRWLVAPQMLPMAGQLAGISCLWALGDFAFSRIVLTRTETLAMLLESLMTSYRLDQAMFLMLLVLAIGVIGFLLWKGVVHVLGRKSLQGL